MVLDLGVIGIEGVGIGRVILIAIIVSSTFFIATIVRQILHRAIQNTEKYMQSRKTGLMFTKHIVTAVIYIMGFSIAMYLIPPFETLAVSLFAGAGIIAAIVGFASQAAFSNIVSGIFIAIFKPFRVGDTIKFGERIGIVEDITLRHTVVKNFENKRFIVPNTVISNEVIENYNIEDERICRYVEIGISYDSDISKAMKIIQQEAMKHPNFIDIRSDAEKKERKPAVSVRVLSFGNSSVNLRAWVWTKSPQKAFELGTNLNKSIKERFDKEGIEIPFPYRTIVYKRDDKRKVNPKKKKTSRKK